MNKDIEKLINPPWMQSIQKIQKLTTLSSLAFENLEAIRPIFKLGESTKLASLGLSELELLDSVGKVAQNSKLASLTLGESEAFRTIRELSESSHFATLASKESEKLNLFNNIYKTNPLSAIAFQQFETAQKLHNFTASSRLESLALEQSEGFRHISQLNNLTSFKSLSRMDNVPFFDTPNLAFPSELGVLEALDKSLIEIDAGISKEISSVTDFNALSENTKSILIYLYHTYFLPIVLSCLSAYVFTNVFEARKETASLTTSQAARSFVKNPNEKFDRSALKGFRVTTANSLNFRENLGSKSEVIATLPVGTLVEVIDKSDRSWLLVEVEIDGVLEQGWISRRYTAYFK